MANMAAKPGMPTLLDPHAGVDQMIVASARHHGAVLVTRDRRLQQYSHVQTVWSHAVDEH
jgi:PIN domain nuclease of toxin-antitoxin system